MAYAGARAPSLLEELEQEMKLLHWHKLANEAALKAALIRSKRLKARDNRVVLQEAKQQERALWIQKVLEEEQQKPLEVTDDFIRTHEMREKRNEEKLAHEVSKHVETLQSLKESLRRREEEKQRHAAYKEKKRALGPPPTKLEDFGTTGDGIGGMSTGRTSRQSGRVSGMSSGSEHGGGTAPVAPNLLQSLNRLVELEKRITKLEDMDGYDAGATPRSGRDSTDAAARALRGKAMTFTKKRTVAAPGAPAKTVFAVKLVDKAVVASRKKLAAPSAASRTAAQSRSWLADRKATQAARRQRMEADYSSGRAGSRATSGSSSWIGNRGSQGRLGVSAPARVGSRPAVAARQLQASRVAPGGPVMGSRKLVGRGATQMNSFHEMRQQFEARKAATRQAAAASRTAPVPSRTAPRAASGSTRASAAGSYKGSSTSTAASRRQAPVKTAWGGSQARPAVRR